jgi:cell division septation protein DedD
MMRNAFRSAAFGLAGTIALLAMPALADVKAGVDAWSRGEYRKAVEEWRSAAVAGDADAQFNLGQAYKLGRGVPVDLAMAQSWYRKAALQGHAKAEANYGLALFDDGKFDVALPWLEKSVARGEPRAQLVLGTMLYNGDGVARDLVRAYALIVRSTASPITQSQAYSVQAQMDQYVPAADRQKGLALASLYEAEAQRPQLPPELSGGRSETAMRDLPPSAIAQPARTQPDVTTAPATPHGGPPVVAQVPPRRTPPAAAEQLPHMAVATGRGWRIQLGAFRDSGNARKLWHSLQGRVGALGGLQAYYVPSGTLTKVQAGPLESSAEVARICAAVRPTGTPCVPVAP